MNRSEFLQYLSKLNTDITDNSLHQTFRQKSCTDKQTDTQTQRAYKWLQVPPFNLTVNVGNENSLLCRLCLAVTVVYPNT